jgi:hypothetical protein
VAGRDECEHTAHRECRAAEQVLASSVRMLRDLRLRCGDTSSSLQKKCSVSFPWRVSASVFRGRLAAWSSGCTAARPGSLGLGDLTLSAYFLLAVTLKELTLCGLGLAHSVRFFTIQDELYTYPTSKDQALRGARSAPVRAARLSDDRHRAYVKTNGSSAFRSCACTESYARAARERGSQLKAQGGGGSHRGGDVGEGKRPWGSVCAVWPLGAY